MLVDIYIYIFPLENLLNKTMFYKNSLKSDKCHLDYTFLFEVSLLNTLWISTPALCSLRNHNS